MGKVRIDKLKDNIDKLAKEFFEELGGKYDDDKKETKLMNRVLLVLYDENLGEALCGVLAAYMKIAHDSDRKDEILNDGIKYINEFLIGRNKIIN